MSDLVGKRLGQYQILSVLGQGGMATVYRATQASMNREVAVKVITGQMADNPDFIARFEREVRLIAQLQHPHILPVYDYGQEGKLLFLVMRLVEGGSLDQRLRHNPLDVRRSARMLTQIASALTSAHDQGIIHRDLKPNNILLDKKDNPYLMDFGIAKLVEGQSRLTATGMVMGTPAYMAPEQWRAESLDLRADIYALGIMLYEMLTGELPFTGDTPYSLMYQHLDAPRPSPVTRRPGIPEGVSNAIQRAMAKDRDNRYSSADAFAEDVNAAMAGLPISGPQPEAPADPQSRTVAEGIEALPPAGPTASPVRTAERPDRTIPEGVDSAAQHAAPTRPGAQPQGTAAYVMADDEIPRKPNRVPQIATAIVALLAIAAIAALVIPRLGGSTTTPTAAAALPTSSLEPVTPLKPSFTNTVVAAIYTATQGATEPSTATIAPTDKPTEKPSNTPQSTQAATVAVAVQPSNTAAAPATSAPTDKPTDKPTDRPTAKPSDTSVPIISQATVTPPPTAITNQATTAATAESGTPISGTSVLIFRADDTLTLYIASKGFVALDGLTIESENTQGQRLSFRLDRSPSFIGLPFTHLPTPTCFQLQSRTRQAPIPIECRQIPPTQLFIERLTPANMIWFDSTVGEPRQVFITRNSKLLGICPVTLAQCEVVIPTE